MEVNSFPEQKAETRMSATLIVRHPVSDYDTWRKTFDSDAVRSLHTKHGVTGSQVLRAPGDANDITVIHEFASTAQANALADDSDLKVAMTSGGVAGAPRIEIFESV